MTRHARALLLTTSLLASGALLSCGPDDQTSPAPDAAAEARETIVEQPRVEVGPVPPAPGLETADFRVRAEPAPAEPEPSRAAPAASPNRVSGANAVSGARAGAGSSVWRDDGRPTWWIDRAGWREGRYALSAEAMGEDVLSARRAAIAAARAEAERVLGGGMRDERVEAAIVRRLSTDAPGSPGRERYVGYVSLSALRGGD